MTFTKNIKQLIKRELGIIANDGSILLTVFIAPLLYIFLLGTIYIHKDINSVDITVVDNDNSKLSHTFIRFIESSQKVNVKYHSTNYEEAKKHLLNIDVHGAVIIPKGFESNIRLLKGSNINVYLNNSRFLMSNEINKTVQKIAVMMGAGIRLRYFEEQGINPKEAIDMVMPVQAEIHFMNNVFNNYGYFLLPGLLILILQQTLFIGLGESLSLEREEKTFSKLLTINSNTATTIIGKNIFYLFLYSAYFILTFSAIFPFFGLPVKGNLFALSVLSILFIIAMILFTNLISLFFKKQIVFMEIAAFTTYPFFLITGFSWPTYALPLPYQIMSNLIPTTPMLEGIIKTTQQNAGFDIIKIPLLILFTQIVIFYTLTHWRYSYLKKKEMHS
jgi:ABC-2 type transport system permease protein